MIPREEKEAEVRGNKYSKIRLMRWGIPLYIVLIFGYPVSPQERGQNATLPNQFEVGVRTSFDFGPLLNYYELFSVRSVPGGTSIERITLTPAGNQCFAPAKVETAFATFLATFQFFAKLFFRDGTRIGFAKETVN